MGAVQEINAILGAMRRNPALVAQIVTEIDTLVSDIALSEGGGSEIVNGSGNGQQFGVKVTMSKRERLAFLQLVMEHYDRNLLASNTARMRF
jgi:hypothetical protein